MNPSIIKYVIENIPQGRILEVGSRDVNGSVRPFIKNQEYLGVDIIQGPGVDKICSIYDLTSNLQPFDVVLCLEVLEHVHDWVRATNALKEITKVGGTLIITTVTKGFPYHGYPHDYWRYNEDDLRQIFRDMVILDLRVDESRNGIYMTAIKEKVPFRYPPTSLKLYSILARRRTNRTPNLHWFWSLQLYRQYRKLMVRFLPRFIKDVIKNQQQ